MHCVWGRQTLSHNCLWRSILESVYSTQLQLVVAMLPDQRPRRQKKFALAFATVASIHLMETNYIVLS